jgi:hypothetical protein
MLKFPKTVLPLMFPMRNEKHLYVSDVEAMCFTIEYDEKLRNQILSLLDIEGKVLLLLVNIGLALCEEGFVEKEARVIARMEELSNQIKEMHLKDNISTQVLVVQAWLSLPNVTPTHVLWNQTMTLLGASSTPVNTTEA